MAELDDDELLDALGVEAALLEEGAPFVLTNRDIGSASGIATLMVTHDPAEALAMS